MRDLKYDRAKIAEAEVEGLYLMKATIINLYDRAIAAEALLVRTGGDKTITGLAKSNIDLLDDNQILRKQKATAEAALAAKTDECERLRGEVVELTMDNCHLTKIARYDGLGMPDLVDSKCGGYAGNMDEPHVDCQSCTVFCMYEDEGAE